MAITASSSTIKTFVKFMRFRLSRHKTFDYLVRIGKPFYYFHYYNERNNESDDCG